MKKGNFTIIKDLWFRLFLYFSKNTGIYHMVYDSIDASNKKILDAFCYTGNSTVKLAKEKPYAEIIGMENNYNLLRLAKRRKRKNFMKNIEFIHLANLDFHEAYFDTAVLFFGLHRLKIQSYEVTIKRIKQTLKPNKKLIIVDLTEGSTKIIKWLLSFYGVFFSKKQIKQFISTDVIEIIESCGFKIDSIKCYNGIKIIESIHLKV